MNNAFFQAINRKTSRLSEWLDNQSPVLKAIGTAALAVGLVVATVKTGGLAGLTFFAAKQTAGAKLVVSVKVKKVFSAAKASVYAGTSMYGQAIFYGEVDFRKVRISALFGGFGGAVDVWLPKSVVPQVVALIGLAATKEATLALTKGDEDNLWR